MNRYYDLYTSLQNLETMPENAYFLICECLDRSQHFIEKTKFRQLEIQKDNLKVSQYIQTEQSLEE